ncbi:short-chain dehydrogenase/reductase-like protein SDR [Kalaharituber pfeilii]|nr:short-chain dehydrogenase/reductase-like protein SDR [Kalaharituber pfeilii]
MFMLRRNPLALASRAAVLRSLQQQQRGLQSAPTLPEFSLVGKTCVVTGAARGLGREFLTAFSLSGAKGACIDLNLEEGENAINGIRTEVAAHFAKSGATMGVPELRAYQCDVTQEGQVKRTWEALVQDFGGKVDVLVTAAGVVENIKAEDYPLDRWKWLMDVNVNGTFLFAREAGRHMIANKTPGSIIMISSMSALIVNRPQLQSAYNTSKAAVSQLMKCMAVEWAPYNIRVNALCPGYQLTPLLKSILAKEGDLSQEWKDLTPMGRLGDPKELRGPIVFMASDASSFMTGHDLTVDGGYTVW